MSAERWDVPSPRLAALAEGMNTPQFRECPGGCPHRHPKGELCGYPNGDGIPCRCTR